jgi:hypothetical protein
VAETRLVHWARQRAILLGDSLGDPPPGHVQLDLVLVPDQAERPTDLRLWRDV